MITCILNTKLLAPDCMRIQSDLITEEIKQEYNTDEYADKEGYILYMEITGNVWNFAIKIPCLPRSQ